MCFSRFSAALSFLAIFCFQGVSFACPLIGGHVDFNCDGKHRITFTGDSITRGVGDADRSFSNGGFVLDIEQDNPESTVGNMGDPGSTAGRLFRKIRRNVQAETPKVVKALRNLDVFMIEVGTNDYWRGTQPKKIVRNIKRLIEFLDDWYENVVDMEKPLYVIGTLPPTRRGYQNPYIAHVNAGLLAAKSASFPVEVRFDRLKSGIIGEDMLHPNAKGYRRMAKKVQRWLDGKGTRRSLALRTDADGDNLYDQLEPTRFGTDPLVPDTDGDGLLDGDEILIHETNPTLADTDSDGIDDATELTNGTDPNDPASL